MKKTFNVGEQVRLKKTLIYGEVKSIFSDTEVYVQFEGEDRPTKMDPNDLSYESFKQLREWWKDLDNTTDEELISMFERIYFERYNSVTKWKYWGVGIVFFWAMVVLISLIY